MFDVSFTELLIIGIVALVVIGPEKLPKVARTAGHLLGRAQRYVSDVKRDIRQEMDAADSLRDLKKEMEDAAQSVKRSVDDTTRTLRNPLEEAQEAMRKAEASVNDTMASLPDASTPAEPGNTAAAPADTPPAPAAEPPADALSALPEPPVPDDLPTPWQDAPAAPHKASEAKQEVKP